MIGQASNSSLRGSVYPKALSRGVVAAGGLYLRAWDRAIRHVEEVQRRELLRIVEHSADTEFGRRHGFGGIRSYEDYAKRVPIGDYDTFSPFIERMMNGETNLVLPEPVRYFGNSSGSSDAGRQKFLPLSDRQIAQTRRAGGETLMRYLASGRDKDFLRGFTLGLFHPALMAPRGSVFVTTNPFLMISKQPAFSRPVYVPDSRWNQVDDYEEKMTAIAEAYLDYDVRAVTGTTCWFPVFFEHVLAVARRRGRPADSIADVWPNLKVLFGGGVTASAYVATIEKLCGRSDVALVDSYNATEGGLYATDVHDKARTGRGMLMMPHRGTFFELVPLESIGDPTPPRVPLWEVEANRKYAIVVTTSAGLFAYKLGDIVRFPSIDPLRIEFVGRLSGCLSITQELTTHAEIESAVRAAVLATGAETVDYGAAADVGVDGTAKSRYLVFVELAGLALPDLAAFGAAFDDAMKAQNRVYREHRGVALLEPKVVPLVRGGAARLMREVTRGNFQGKFPRILSDEQKAKALAYAEK